MSEIKPTFSGEMQLAGWSESHTGGCKVAFWLSSPDELAAFRDLTVRKGNQAGHRFMVVLVEIGDDELPIPPAAESPPVPRAHIGDACWRTVSWCKVPNFWKFLIQTFGYAQIKNEKQAAGFVRMICGIQSRKELDTDDTANKAWHQKIREPYRLWLIENPG